jgi:tetratricopeptide (TPR) repeat protein
MSDDTSFALEDPFSPTALDEATELRALSHALQLAQGFKLIFARCNQNDQREKLVSKLRNDLLAINIQEIHFTKPVAHLLDALRLKISVPAPDALFVSGLEYSLPTAADAHQTPFVANLNASRNLFPEIVSCPLALWIPEYVLNAIMLGAPDFFSIRSGTYFFAAEPGDTAVMAAGLTLGSESRLGDLTVEEKRQRVKAIESLLADYESLPVAKRSPVVEMRLRLRLANLLNLLGSYDSAIPTFEALLNQAQKMKDLGYQRNSYEGLGIAYFYLGGFSAAREAFEHGLRVSREMADRASEGVALANIGSLYGGLGDIPAARKAYEQSLEIKREVGDQAGEGLVQNNLGYLLAQEGEFKQAEELLKQSLEIARKIDAKQLEATTLLNLGNIYHRQGRLPEAEISYHQSLGLARQLGDRENEWNTLRNLSIVSERHGILSDAIDYQRRAVKLLEGWKGIEAEAARKRLEKLDQKAQQQDEAKEQLA